MADVEIVRCRDCIHAEHREDIERGKRACMVRDGLGGFIVPEDGFCFLGEERRNTCVECLFYCRYQNKDLYGKYWYGVCCSNRLNAHGTDDDSAACEEFEQIR